MPIYEYQCQECGALKEAIQRISDPPLKDCEVCGGVLKRLISAPAFQFKGSGWYVTDYAGKGKGKDQASKGDASTSDSGGGSSEGGSSKSSGDASSSKAGSGSDSKKTAKSA